MIEAAPLSLSDCAYAGDRIEGVAGVLSTAETADVRDQKDLGDLIKDNSLDFGFHEEPDPDSKERKRNKELLPGVRLLRREERMFCEAET